MHKTPAMPTPLQATGVTTRSGGLRWQAPALALLLATGVALSPGVRAQSGLSMASALSALPMSVVVAESGEPIASVAAGASVASAAVVVVPVALSAAGAVLVVKAVEVGAQGSVYALERTSDGARVSVRVVAHSASAVALAVGSALVVTLVSAGTVLSAAGEVVAFIPNALGRSLLHHERLSG